MCLQLTTIYTCGHSKTKLKHCRHHDPEDAGPFSIHATCPNTTPSTRERLTVCKSCDVRMVREAEEKSRKMRRELRDHERKMKKMQRKECGVM
jgi:hypothetical protein